jgi:YaiO family outer membrane protein
VVRQFPLILMTLVGGGISVAPAPAQSHEWSADYAHEQAAVSTNGVDGTWTIDRFSTMWSRPGKGGGLLAVEPQRRAGVDDVALLTRAYRRAGDWTFGADAAVAPDADFLCRAAGGGDVSYRAVGTLVASGGYHFLRYPSANFHRFEPALTLYPPRGEFQARLYVNRDATNARTSTTALVRGVYDIRPRLRLGAGGSVGDRIFNIAPLVKGAADGRLGYAETRLGLTERDFVLAVVTVAREEPAFTYVSFTLGYKRMF